jgi:hypothetical protein
MVVYPGHQKLGSFRTIGRPDAPAPRRPILPKFGFVLRIWPFVPAGPPEIGFVLHDWLRELGLFDAYDKSRGGKKFTINLYFIWIYVRFYVDRPGAGFIL